MPPKVVLVMNILVTVTMSGLLGTQGNINIAELSEYTIEWYREVIT